MCSYGAFRARSDKNSLNDLLAILGELMDNTVNVAEYGVSTDGRDSTAAIASLFSGLPEKFMGVVVIPAGVKYRFDLVSDKLPLGATVIDNSVINGWSTDTWKQKIIGVWERGDGSGAIDLNYTISSGHNAMLMLDNRGTAGSESSKKRFAGIAWTTGRYKYGNQGLRSMARLQFGQSPNRPDLWALVLRKANPWAARNHEIWRSGQEYSLGDTVISSNAVYKADNFGVAGEMKPSHRVGSMSDGGVSWSFIEASRDALLFAVDEQGRISTNGSSVGYTYRFKQSVLDKEPVVAAFEAAGEEKSVELKLVPTNSEGALVKAPYFQSLPSETTQLVSSNGVVWAASSNQFDVGSLGRIERRATDGEKTPSVKMLGALVVENSKPTSISNFIDGSPRQEVILLFMNDNTTLLNSWLVKLKDSKSVTPKAGAIITIKKFEADAESWYEVSRNF